VKYNDVLVGEAKGKSNEEISIKLSNENFKPWSPSEPNLYSITADLLLDSGEKVDSITSYTTIRKIESKRDSKTGKLRIYLNNNPLFNIGPLDQGYWPDGIYTAPSDEAMVYDIQKLKELGYNTIRKHVKTEPFRYYYYCDKIGMVLWQDMPSGNVDGS
jgi:beta-galactosidase/beta-glucuronidase